MEDQYGAIYACDIGLSRFFIVEWTVVLTHLLFFRLRTFLFALFHQSHLCGDEYESGDS